MGILSKLFGGSRADPPGTRYILEGNSSWPAVFRIKRVLPGQSTGSPDLETVGPEFTDAIEAERYRSALEGGPAYRYPSGRV